MRLRKKSSYTAAIYLRLSREDGDKAESDSIHNQRELIKEYLSKNKNLNYVGEYVDDGYSGTSFDRPDFQRLIGDVKTGKVNCIVVKDLSRLGRNYIETGRYIEQIFPLLGVRFIAVLCRSGDPAAQAFSESVVFLFVLAVHLYSPERR